MTRTRYTLDDLGGSLSERSLVSFLTHLPPESATVREAAPDVGGWSRTDMLLARLVEGVEQLLWVTMCRGVKKSKWPPRPERIVRPGVSDNKRRIGRDPIPIEDFDEWYGGDS